MGSEKNMENSLKLTTAALTLHLIFTIGVQVELLIQFFEFRNEFCIFYYFNFEQSKLNSSV